VIRSGGPVIDVDIATRIDALRGRHHDGIDGEALRRVRLESKRLLAQLQKLEKGRTRSVASPSQISATPGTLAALAYPDRVAKRRPGARARFILRNGRGAELHETDSLASAAFIVAAQLDDRKPEARVFLAAGVSEDEVRRLFADQIRLEDAVEFDQAADAVVARRVERLGAIVLRESTIPDADETFVRAALIEEIRRRGIATLPWSENASRLRRRMAFVAAHDPAWPDVSDEALLDQLDEWLAPSLHGVRRIGALSGIDLSEALQSLLDWRQRRALDELAPTHVVVPTGSRVPIDYDDPDSPTVAVRLQEVFGLTESPRVLAGRVAVTMQLLSPAHRPVQTTRDLAGFWRTSYFDVRRDLRGRYPRHEWPEDPLSATPTKRAKPRR
jgi:ATP-dependent helicase HrpB